MRIQFTEESAAQRDQLDPDHTADLAKVMQLILDDPTGPHSHQIPGTEVRQVITQSMLCVTYTIIGNLTLIVVLSVYSTAF